MRGPKNHQGIGEIKMSGKLKELLSLPDPRQAESSAQVEEFSRAFRTRLAGVNQELRVVASQASRADFQSLETQRDKLVQAYQRTSSKIDPADPAKADRDMQRVFDAAAATEKKAAAAATSAAKMRDRWLALEPDFDEALLRVSELEEAGEKKATALRKLSDVIRDRANDRSYSDSASAFEQMRGKLDRIYKDYSAEANGAATNGAAPSGAAAAPVEGFTVLVKDSVTGQGVADVMVEVGGQTDVTSTHGLATVELPVGEHGYSASRSGYESAAGTVRVVEGDNPELVIEISAPREGLTVLVRDESTGQVVEGAQATVGDQTDATSSNGLATLELPAGSHSYEIVAEGYETVTGRMDVVVGDNPELVVDLTATTTGTGQDAAPPAAGTDDGVVGTITFEVVEEFIGPLEGATVEAAGQSTVTDASGRASLTVSVGKTAYSVSAENFETVRGELDVNEGENPPVQAPLSLTDEAIEASIRDEMAHVRVTVVDENDQPVDNALVRIHSKSAGVRLGHTDSSGVATVSLAAAIEEKQTVSASLGNIAWKEATIPAATLAVGNTYDVTLKAPSQAAVGMVEVKVVRKGSQKEVAECYVQLDPFVVPVEFTDAAGKARFENVPPGKYQVIALDLQASSGEPDRADATVQVKPEGVESIQLELPEVVDAESDSDPSSAGDEGLGQLTDDARNELWQEVEELEQFMDKAIALAFA